MLHPIQHGRNRRIIRYGSGRDETEGRLVASHEIGRRCSCISQSLFSGRPVADSAAFSGKIWLEGKAVREQNLFGPIGHRLPVTKENGVNSNVTTPPRGVHCHTQRRKGLGKAIAADNRYFALLVDSSRLAFAGKRFFTKTFSI